MVVVMPSLEDSDESLMKSIQMGQHQAFAILVRKHTDRFFKTAYRLCGDIVEAEDMVQDAFLKIWKNPNLWQDGKGAKFTTWFYRILVNQNIDRLRQTKTKDMGEGFLENVRDEKQSVEHDMMMNEEQDMIEKALSSLPVRQKMAITMCFYEGLSNAEAAQVLGVKIKALESLLMRAKAGLKDVLKDNFLDLKSKGESYGTR